MDSEPDFLNDNVCHICKQSYKNKNILKKHIKNIHLNDGIKYPCNQCDHQASSKGNLQTHIQCDYQATQQSSLRTHIQSAHTGIKYPCNQCDYKATQQGNLQSHILAKHSDNILKCEHCDFQTKWRQMYYSHKSSCHGSLTSLPHE